MTRDRKPTLSVKSLSEEKRLELHLRALAAKHRRQPEPERV